MAFEFARQMEREAEELAQGFEAAIDGVKPWYSYARLFDGPATRVFVGINPGGTGKSEELDKEYREWAYEKPGYCAWLDGEVGETQRRTLRDWRLATPDESASSVPGDVRRELGRHAEEYSVFQRCSVQDSSRNSTLTECQGRGETLVPEGY